MREGLLTEHDVILLIIYTQRHKDNKKNNNNLIKMYTKGENKHIFMHKDGYNIFFLHVLCQHSAYKLQFGSSRCINWSLCNKDRRKNMSRTFGPLSWEETRDHQVLLVLALSADIYKL